MRSKYLRLVLMAPLLYVKAQLRQMSSTDCRGPAITPQNYDINNVAQEMISEGFLTDLQNACAQNGNGDFQNAGACSDMLYKAEDTIYTLYATSDADLVYIYQGLFGCPNPTNPAIYHTTMNDYQTLLKLNETVFGTPSTPGLMRNLLTLMDGIQAVQAVASGQMTSLKQAASNQRQATQGIQAQLLATAASLKDQTLSFMTMLVGNRTNVQKASFESVGQSVKDAIKDIKTQAEGITNTATADFDQLQDQYNRWSSDTNKALTDVTSRAQSLKSQVNTLTEKAKTTVSNLGSKQGGVVSQAFKDTVTGFNSDIIAAQDQVAVNVAQLGSDMTDMVNQNKAGFESDLLALQNDLDGDLSGTKTAVTNNPNLLSTATSDATEKARVSMGSLYTLVQSTVLPLVANVQGAMNSVITLQAAILAAQTQVSNDISSIQIPATQEVARLGKTITSTFSSDQSTFDSNFASIKTNMESQMQTKVAEGRSALKKILESVTETQGGAAKQQMYQGKISDAQVTASMDAADLINAQAQSAADNTQAGLDGMVGFVGSALSDAQDTIQAVAQSNLGQITSASGKIKAVQQAATDEANAQVNAASRKSSAMASQTQSDSNAVQLAGINLQNSLQQAGTSLKGSVAYQNSQAQALLSDVNGILQTAQQYGGSLSDQMTSFEQQMPALYKVLVSKIAAYQALMSSQGAQAQTSASNTAAADASDSLGNLVSELQSITSKTTGTTASLSAKQAATATDATSVIDDIKSLNNKITEQGVTGAGLISAAAQRAAAQTAAQVQSASKDSASAVTALMQYNADLVKSTQADVLTSGDAAMSSALNAARYLTKNAQNYVSLSNQFVLDAQNVLNSGQVNLSSMLNTLNATLTGVTNSAKMYGDQMTNIASQLSGWPGEVSLEASNINAAIQAKITEVTNSILKMNKLDSNSTANTQQIARELQTYIDQLNAVYQRQRDAFNQFQQQYALRRIAMLTGLNASILAQKAAFLQSLASADLDQSGRAAQTTSVLQGLANAIQAASKQGGMDSDRLAALVANIGSGVSSLTQTLANQMTTQVSSLKQQAVMNGMSVGNSMGGTVNSASANAHLLGNQFAAALSQIGGSDVAIQLAADGSNQDAYTIAGLLNSTSQSTRVQIASLLREVEAGNMTMQQVVETAQKLSEAQVSTVEDVINAFGSHISAHVSNVDNFENSIELSASALNTTASHAVLPHTALQADVIADIAASAGTISALRGNLLPGSGPNASKGQIEAIQTSRSNNLQALETNVTKILYGSDLGSKSSLSASIPGLSSGFLQMHPRLSSISFLAQRKPSPTQAPPTLPDMISQVNVALSTASTNVTKAQADASALISREIKSANAQIREILSITASALGVQVPPGFNV